MNRRSFFALLGSTALLSPQAALAESCRFQEIETQITRDLGAQVLRGVRVAALTVGALLAVAVTGAAVGAVLTAVAAGTVSVPMLAFVGVVAVRGFAPAMRRLATSLGDRLDQEVNNPIGAFNVQYD